MGFVPEKTHVYGEKLERYKKRDKQLLKWEAIQSGRGKGELKKSLIHKAYFEKYDFKVYIARSKNK